MQKCISRDLSLITGCVVVKAVLVSSFFIFVSCLLNVSGTTINKTIQFSVTEDVFILTAFSLKDLEIFCCVSVTVIVTEVWLDVKLHWVVHIGKETFVSFRSGS